MVNSTHMFSIIGTILITIIVLSLIGVLETPAKKKEQPTTIIYPERNVYLSPPRRDIIYGYNRPVRVVNPNRYLKPIFRRGPRFGHRHRYGWRRRP